MERARSLWPRPFRTASSPVAPGRDAVPVHPRGAPAHIGGRQPTPTPRTRPPIGRSGPTMSHTHRVTHPVASRARRTAGVGAHAGLVAMFAGLVAAASLGWVLPAFAQSDLLLHSATAASQTVFVVDVRNTACSNTGPGTNTTPYFTITAALSAHH